MRAIFVGLFIAARDGLTAIPLEWREQLSMTPPVRSSIPAFLPSLRSCLSGASGGSRQVCERRSWLGEIRMRKIHITAVVAPMASHGRLQVYRIYVRTDA